MKVMLKLKTKAFSYTYIHTQVSYTEMAPDSLLAHFNEKLSAKNILFFHLNCK